MRGVLLAALAFYRRRLSPWMGGGCRFEPSCSRYASGCIERHGALLGLRLAAGRLGRCREGCPAGRDPVPGPGEVEAALQGRLVRTKPLGGSDGRSAPARQA